MKKSEATRVEVNDKPMTAKEYMQQLIEPGLYCAHRYYFPFDRETRLHAIKVLGHDIGAALAAWPRKDVEDLIGSLYGSCLVKHTLDSVGPLVDAKVFYGWIWESYNKGQKVASKR